tara:strand:+ start:548 stop:703 length:156 start_codon:yes stop_codon:yes gene_type:complete
MSIKNKISQGYTDFAIIGAKPKGTLEKINPKMSRVPRKLYIVYCISENVRI